MSVSSPTLETERLILRRLELADAARVRDLVNHPDIAATTLHIPHPYPEGAAEDWISGTHEGMETGEGYTFAMVLKQENDLIGSISLVISAAHQRAEMGYWLGKPYWGQGYTTEAARRLLLFGFEELQLNRIHAAYFSHNVASGRVMEKIGMRHEGTLRQHYFRWDTFHDAVFYGLLRSEYEVSMQDKG